MSQLTLYLHMIPMVGFQQMVRIRIFLQDGRPLGGILNTGLITVIATETGSGVVVAAIAKVVHLQGVAAHEDTTAPGYPCPEILCLRIACQPEAVQVTQTVTFPTLIHDTGIVLDSHPRLHLLLAPERKPFG